MAAAAAAVGTMSSEGTAQEGVVTGGLEESRESHRGERGTAHLLRSGPAVHQNLVT